MTFRLCLLGNSHVGAFKRAWDRIGSEFPGLSITMFGAPGRKFADIDIVDGSIVATSEDAAASLMATGGGSRAALDDYDACAVIGGSARLFTVASLLRDYRPPFMNPALLDPAHMEAHPELPSGLKSFYRKSDPVLASNAMFRDIMRAANAHCHAVRLIKAMAAQTTARLGHVATPFPSSALLGLKPKHVVCRIVGMGYGPAFAELIWSALGDALPPSVRIVRPPAELLSEGLLTDRVYSDGSMRLDDGEGEHGETDFFHMNDAYGEVMLRRLIGEIRA